MSSSINLLLPLDKDKDTIEKFFENKNVFITGASGFLGKALIERLLRCSPKIGNIYILMRLKKSMSLEQRLKTITENILFDQVREKWPEAFTKIIPILGDVRELNLGISAEDRRMLIERVSIVYHIAATVRFDEPLRDAILMNTRGTREVCQLVLNLKHIDVFAHISTAYCHVDKAVIEEKMYRGHNTEWEKMITIAEKSDGTDRNLAVMTEKIISKFPNTYTYTKALAESVVIDLCEGKVPTVVLRPTIVISSLKDPFTGWIDNQNGPYGLILGEMTGIIRIVHSKPTTLLSLVPADLVISTFVKSVWIHKHLDTNQIAVYNCCNDAEFALTTGGLLQCQAIIEDTFQVKPIWYPEAYMVPYYSVYLVGLFILQIFPALVIDFFLHFTNRKIRLLKIYRKIFVVLDRLSYFMQNDWVYRNDNHLGLDKHLCLKEEEIFSVNVPNNPSDDYKIENAKWASRILLKDKCRNLDRRIKRVKRMKKIHMVLKKVILIFCTYCFFSYLLVPGFCAYCNYVENL